MRECFYARSANASGEKETLRDHAQRVSQLCGEFLKPIGYTEIGHALGGLHDFGKASDRFAEVLEGKRVHVNHAYPGAALAYFQYKQKKNGKNACGCDCCASQPSGQQLHSQTEGTDAGNGFWL